MKKSLKLTLALAMSLMAGSALAADKVVLQLKWVAQAQFAGYFVAKDKGFVRSTCPGTRSCGRASGAVGWDRNVSTNATPSVHCTTAAL